MHDILQDLPTTFLYHDGRELTLTDNVNSTIEIPLNITCIVTETNTKDTRISWTIEGTSEGHTSWRVVVGPDASEIGHMTWSVSETVEITTSRKNCPAISVSCIGNDNGVDVGSSAETSLNVLGKASEIKETTHKKQTV